MTILTIRRLAADIMKVGENRIRVKPDEIKRAGEAITRADVRNLIKEGIVYAVEKRGRRKVMKGKKRGCGGRKGKHAKERKRMWITRVRSQRAYLAQLIQDGRLEKKFKRSIYKKIKSGLFKNKKSMTTYLKENSLLKEKAEEKSGEL